MAPRLGPATASAALAALATPAVAAAHAGHVEGEPSAGLLHDWELPPFVVLGTVLLVAAFVRAFIRLRRRGRTDHAPWSRAALFGAGVTIGVLSLVSPLATVGESYLVSGHMLQHVLLGDVAPALVLVAVRGPLLFALLPAAMLGAAHRSRAVRGTLSVLFRPAVSFAVWAAFLLVWHAPPVYELAARNEQVHIAQHACFVVGGVLVWAQLVDPARRNALELRYRLGFVLGMLAVGTLLANVLILSYRPIYASYAEQHDRLLGLSPLADQQWAALVMLIEQLVVLGAFAFWWVRVWLRAPLEPSPARHPFAA